MSTYYQVQGHQETSLQNNDYGYLLPSHKTKTK